MTHKNCVCVRGSPVAGLHTIAVSDPSTVLSPLLMRPSWWYVHQDQSLFLLCSSKPNPRVSYNPGMPLES